MVQPRTKLLVRDAAAEVAAGAAREAGAPTSAASAADRLRPPPLRASPVRGILALCLLAFSTHLE